MHYTELFSEAALKYELDAGHVNAQTHPELPLTIYNYTPAVQHENIWNIVTSVCRGLILDANGEVVARPFAKFHNINTENHPETMMGNLPDSYPVITEKMDGSLGILWRYEWKGKWHSGIATRGSFTSAQAQWATKWFKEFTNWLHIPDTTPLFEIIYPENRIVVQYNWQGLVLLAIKRNCDGSEMSYATLNVLKDFNPALRLVARVNSSLDTCLRANIPNEEGYVATWPSNTAEPLRVKIKFEDYKQLHKVLTMATNRTVWELLASGAGTANLMNNDLLPKDFKAWLTTVEDTFQKKYNWALTCAMKVISYPGDTLKMFGTLTKEEEKKRAEYILNACKEKTYHGVNLVPICFGLAKGRDVSAMIWSALYPERLEKFSVSAAEKVLDNVNA